MITSSVEESIHPERLGAKVCPNCKTGANLLMQLKTVAARTHFAELSCTKCFRESISEVHMSHSKCIQQVIERWNSRWPDISYYLSGDSVGIDRVQL